MTTTNKTPAELTAHAWAASMSDASTFTQAAEAHERAEAAHRTAARTETGSPNANRATVDNHYSLANTHRLEARMIRNVIASGR